MDAFVDFTDFVDQKCKESLDQMYGKFAGFTDPIINQKTLSEISDMFKSTLSKSYHIVAVLLNKADYLERESKKSMRGQWDRDILYQFLTTC